jgi:molybdate transport system permease protein
MTASRSWRRARRPSRGERTVLAAALPLMLFLALPLAALVARAAGLPVLDAFDRPEVVQAVTLSLATSTATTAIALVVGTPLAYALARWDFPGRGAVDALVDVPVVLPPAVAGVALLLAFGRRGWFGPAIEAAGLEIAFTPVAVVLAQLFVSAPYFVRAAAGGFARVDRDLEESARLDGATGLGVFRHIVVPLTWPALVGGLVMTWARALGEFGATIIFAGNLPGRTQTMPLAIYLGFELDLATALALSLVLLAVSGGVLATVKALGGRLAPER